MSQIHPTAIIEAGAKIGNNTVVEPYAIIKGNVTIGAHCKIKSHVYLDGNTTIGDHVTIWPFTSIGAKPQDLKYKGEKTFVTIGNHTEIRECVTINSSCGEGQVVKVGDNCLVMACCHIAHNCVIGNHVIMSNGVLLAGHVEVGDFAIIGGMTPLHQFVRVGSYAMVGGMSRVTHDIPPFTIGGNVPFHIAGLNMVGLKRHNFDLSLRQQLTKAFKLTYRSGYTLSEAIAKIEQEVESSPSIRHWVDFCKKTKRGLIDLQNKIPKKMYSTNT